MNKRRSDSIAFNVPDFQQNKLNNKFNNNNNQYIKFYKQINELTESNNNLNKSYHHHIIHNNHKRSKSNLNESKNCNINKSNIIYKLKNNENFFHFNSPSTHNSYKEFSISLDKNEKYQTNMEDCFCIAKHFEEDTNKSMFCLFDGHGGIQVAKYLSKYFVDYFNRYLEKYPNENTENLFKKIFKKIDSDIKKYVSESNEIGSTGTIIYITKEYDPKIGMKKMLYCANVGDSRSVLFTNNNCKRITYEHKCSDTFEDERIKNENGFVLNNRLNGILSVSRAFGDFNLKGKGLTSEPSIHKTEINTNVNNFVVLCTDGIWDVVNEEDIFYLTLNNNETEKICKEILSLGKQRDSKDNMSCIVIKI